MFQQRQIVINSHNDDRNYRNTCINRNRGNLYVTEMRPRSFFKTYKAWWSKGLKQFVKYSGQFSSWEIVALLEETCVNQQRLSLEEES
jgi:hypothetical protein